MTNIKEAMAEIEAILKKHDLAGIIILHESRAGALDNLGRIATVDSKSETLIHLETKDSFFRHSEDGGVRVKINPGTTNIPLKMAQTVNILEELMESQASVLERLTKAHLLLESAGVCFVKL